MRLAEQLQPSRLTALPPRLYASTRTACYPPTQLIHVNTDLLRRLGLSPQSFLVDPDLSGLPAIATVYAGHQFGIYTSQLGDGRVHILGDVIADDGMHWEIQLKGAGATPYARGNSGRMSLAEAITEYLGCEAMAGLGIATTRGLALLESGVANAAGQANAWIFVRTAPSHLRFGHFEYLHNQQDHTLLRELADHVIAQHYPALLQLSVAQRYREFLFAVTQRTAHLLAQWQAVGFVHGVMNTDNMSILGLTLDYGVFGFMPVYDPAYSANANDEQHRYAFNQQVDVARWNCLALAEALVALLPGQRIPASLLRHFRQAYNHHWLTLMRTKLGLTVIQPEDAQLIGRLLALLHQQQVDYTRFFRRFSRVAELGETGMTDLVPAWDRAFQTWFADYRQRLTLESVPAETRTASMLAHNPKYILRQELVAQAIARAECTQDFALLQDLLRVLQAPYAEHENSNYLA